MPVKFVVDISLSLFFHFNVFVFLLRCAGQKVAKKIPGNKTKNGVGVRAVKNETQLKENSEKLFSIETVYKEKQSGIYVNSYVSVRC